MSKFIAIVVTAAICLPIGALFRSDASAERRRNDLDTHLIEGYGHLSRAQAALHEAMAQIDASVRADEALWSDQTGRAEAVKQTIEQAVSTMDSTAKWVENGLIRNGNAPLSPLFTGRFLVKHRQLVLNPSCP